MKKSKTIKDAYTDYAKENTAIEGVDKYFNIDYKTYKDICLEFNKEVSDEIIKEALTGKLEFIQDKDGNREEFDQSDYKQKYLEYIDEQYKRFKKETLTDLKNK